jgi:hypothetical protein
MSRGWLIAAGVVAAIAVAGVLAWLLVLRDTTTPVGVEEAVTSFQTETGSSPRGEPPIPEGVYVYATAGFEKTDALTGVTHRYPKRTTIAVRPAECGVSLLWRVFAGRSTDWTFCVTSTGWELHTQDERHTFFGHTETTTYTCKSALIRPGQGGPVRWPVSCTTGDSHEQGVGRAVGREALDVAGASVATEHVRKRTTYSGAIGGSAQYDFWFDRMSGVPVRIVMSSETTNGSPIGDVTYDEDVSLRLTSLEPRR